MQNPKPKTSSGNKKFAGIIKLQVESKKATPTPPIGPALGQKSLNIMDFCKQFNAATQDKEGPIPVVITYYTDKTFDFILKTSPASYSIKKAAGIKSGSKEPGKVNVGTIKTSQLREIAIVKKQDMSSGSMRAAIKTLAGTATSIGLDIIDDENILKN